MKHKDAEKVPHERQYPFWRRKTTVIAAFTIAAIFLHLLLRFGFRTTPTAYPQRSSLNRIWRRRHLRCSPIPPRFIRLLSILPPMPDTPCKENRGFFASVSILSFLTSRLCISIRNLASFLILGWWWEIPATAWTPWF